VAQTKDDVGRRENNMTQITSIKLGLIAICIATVPLTLAQTPRIGINGSNKTAPTMGTAAGHSGLSGNFPNAVQPGTNALSGTNTGLNANVGAHIGINAGAQTGISNSTGGIINGAGGLGSSSGNLTATTQIGTNARAGTNTTSTNAGANTAAASRPASVTTILPQPIRVPTPLPNNSPVGQNFSTAGQSPSPLPSASVTPTPTPAPTPAQLL